MPLAERAASDFVVRGGVNYLGPSVPRTRTNPTRRFMPRFGFAYAATSRLVLRGGYGIYCDTLDVSHLSIVQPGFSRPTPTTMTNNEGVSWNWGYFTGDNPPVTDPFPVREDGTRFDETRGDKPGVSTSLGRSFSFPNPNYQPAKQHRGRLESQRQVVTNAVFSIAYVGSWVGNQGVDHSLNPLPEKFWAGGLVRNNAVAQGHDAAGHQPVLHHELRRPSVDAAPLLPGDGRAQLFTSRTIQEQQLLRPFPHMAGLTIQADPIGKNK